MTRHQTTQLFASKAKINVSIFFLILWIFKTRMANPYQGFWRTPYLEVDVEAVEEEKAKLKAEKETKNQNFRENDFTEKQEETKNQAKIAPERFGLPEIVIGKKYRLLRRIGAGSHAVVYIGLNIYNGEKVAIKFEPSNKDLPQLFYEAKLYELLQGGVGIPKIHWSGLYFHKPNQEEIKVLVMDLLGTVLEQKILKSPGQKLMK